MQDARSQLVCIKAHSHDGINHGCNNDAHVLYRSTIQNIRYQNAVHSLNDEVNSRPNFVIGRRLRASLRQNSKVHNGYIRADTRKTLKEENSNKPKGNEKGSPPEEKKFKSITEKRTFLQSKIIFVKPFTLCDRLNSFRNWPTSSTVPTSSLVEAGFVHRDGELCVCPWCDLVIDAATLNGKRPLDVHRERSPSCEYIIHYGSDIAVDSQQPISNPFVQNHQVSNCRRQTNTVQHDSGSDDSTRGLPSDGRLRSQAINDVTDDCPVPVIVATAYNPRNPEMVTEQARRDTFMYWPHTALVDTGYIAETGFFFIGTNDTVRCFYCDIGLADWSNEDDPWVEHARFSPDCPFLRQKKPRQFIENIQREWSQIYCPKHPEMSDLQARVRTFVNSSWPSDLVTQDPQQIAMAGFYYKGEGDTVRCHYCDGGLREWEPGDDPWFEHARWFPFCKYVLRTKGQEFIRMCSTDISNDTVAATAPNPPPSVSRPSVPLVSYAEDCRKKETKNPMLSAAAESVRIMGYSKCTVKSAINEYISKTGRRTFTAQELMEIIVAREEKGAEFILSDGEEDQCEADDGSSGDEEMQLSSKAYEKENEYLKDRLTCIDCKTRERSTVFLPCGHRIMCDTCSRRTDTCNSCGSAIDRRIKTFLS